MTMNRRLGAALACVALLGGCGIFKKGDNRPKTAVLGERIPVLNSESDASVEPALADVPVTVPAPVANDSWGQTGGSATKAMQNLALGTSLTPGWTAAIKAVGPRQRLAAAPVIANGRVYLTDGAGTVHAFDEKTGARVWSTELDDAKKDRPVLFGGGVSVEAGKIYATDGRGDAAALDAGTGKLLWKTRPGGPLRGAPGLGFGLVFVQSSDNQVFALKPDTGETVWTVSATLQTAGVYGVAAPAMANGTVVAGFSSGELSALRYENGRIVWQDQLSRTSITTSVSAISDIDASPVIDQGKVYAIGQGGRMVAMDLFNGQRQWELNIGGIATPWLAGEWLFTVTDEARLLCIARSTGKVRWVTDLQRWRDPKGRNKQIGWYGPVLAGGRLLLVNTLGQLTEVGLDGKVIGTRRVSKAGFYLGPVVADNRMVLVDAKGKITSWQ
jgi:outer membrane protein assembly factor BamB